LIRLLRDGQRILLRPQAVIARLLAGAGFPPSGRFHWFGVCSFPSRKGDGAEKSCVPWYVPLVDDARVWQVITHDLPRLEQQAAELLREGG
jgi:hypothetical protein